MLNLNKNLQLLYFFVFRYFWSNLNEDEDNEVKRVKGGFARVDKWLSLYHYLSV